jgi:phenylpropionate dioxygenase-like ring-hydroxylating dioxygenase large terminal subunit
MDSQIKQIIDSYKSNVPLAEAETISGPWYTDERIAELERQNVFGGTWQMVGRLAQLENPGDFITTQVGGEPIVIVRSADKTLKAFYNVCRHHAAAVVTQPCGNASIFRCPYHGWSYGTDGALKGVPEFEGVCNFDRAKNGLVPIRVEAWEKFVFVNLNNEAPSLQNHLGKMVEQFKPLGLANLHFAERREYTLECNWKVFVDNYLDGGYHVPHLHKGLNSILTYKDYTIENFERFCLQSSPIDAAGGEAMTAAVRKGQALYYWLYPNLMLNWYEGYLDTNFIVPLAINKMKVVFEFYFADVSDAAKARNKQSMDVSERIQDEDHNICESVQRGLSSRAYRAGRLSVRREAGEQLFHQLLHHDLTRGLRQSVAAD